ncbi:TcpQ domain-containing protein [Burkholderia gladioli]|uniref:TcpQ domain-containing protein n=1 Tax=Burkholderia gladioli TaxID=28095 RepID=UPI001FCA3B33|nr:TcpQ domain-containing protein [Burkholderia gladioli]MDN7465826.1 TcpQ domain-containing protein [Burkholderia gladioli]
MMTHARKLAAAVVAASIAIDACAADTPSEAVSPMLRLSPYLPKYSPPLAASAPVAASPAIVMSPVVAASQAMASVAVPVTPTRGETLPAPAPVRQSSNLAPIGSLSATESVVAVSPVRDLVEPYRLEAGLSIQDQLMAWCKRAGWKLLWNLPPDDNWIVPGARDYGTDFEQAISTVVRTLASNGADIRGEGHRDNHTFVVRPGGNQ